MEIADVGYKEPALFLASKIATHLYFFLLSDWPIFIDLYLSLQLFVLLLLSLVKCSSSVTMLFSSQNRMPVWFFSVTCLCGISLFVESPLSCSSFSYFNFSKT